MPDLSGIFDLTLLNQVLTEKGLAQVSSNPNSQPQSDTNQTQYSESVTSNTENLNTVPEFGPIAPIVFAIAVMGIVFATKTKVIQKL